MAGRTARIIWCLCNPGILNKARKRSRQVVQRARIGHVLVLCYGNIYRSPFASALLRSILPGTASVSSAGFHPNLGRSTPSPFVRLGGQYGVDLANHKSEIVSPDQIAGADIIVIMDRWNWSSLKSTAPGCLGKVVWLGAFGTEADVEIEDPYGKDVSKTRRIARRLSDSTRGLCNQLIIDVDKSNDQ